MSLQDVKQKTALFELCKKHGFTKVRSSLYRCFGDGLLQVIMIPNSRSCLPNLYSAHEVYVGVFSLYSKLNWISSVAVRRIFQYDLHLTLCARDVFVSDSADCWQSNDLLDILKCTIAGLSQICTHTHLAGFLEEIDRRINSGIRWNDGLKIAPYVLSEQCEKGLLCISAIEKQMWDAFAHNKKHPGYDEERHKQSIEADLAPLVQLRNSIDSRDRNGVTRYLQANYEVNLGMLRKLDVPYKESHKVLRARFCVNEDE